MSAIVPNFFPTCVAAPVLPSAFFTTGGGAGLLTLNGLFSAAAYASKLNKLMKYRPKNAMIALTNPL